MSERSSTNQDMIDWADETGSTKCQRPNLTVADICDFFSEGLSDRESTEIQDFLCLVEAYNLWLRNTCGSLLSLIRSNENQLNRGLAKGMRSMGKTFASNDVKEAMILNKQPQLAKVKDRLTKLRMKYDKISRLPQSIDASIRTIENVLRRRNGS